MPGPWEKYQSAHVPAEGPWGKYAAQTATVDPAAALAEHAQSLDYKMAVARGRPAETLPQYAGRTLKEMALPATLATVGTVGGLPGQMTGAALGETLNQALDITPSRSVIPEVDKPNLTRVGIAAGAQAAVPLLATGAKSIYGLGKSLVEPFYQRGRDAIIGRTLKTAAGGQDVTNALRTAQELVPGSLPTVGEASGNAGLASLEKSARAISPEVKNAFQMREAAQNAARLEALASIAGTPAEKALAEQARKQATAPLLQTLSNSQVTVNTQPTISLIDQLMARSPGREKLVKTLAQVKASLVDDAGNLRTNPAQLYQGARKNIADLLAARAGDGSKINEAIARELTTVMKSLDHQIGKAEPAYKTFMAEYAAMSKPINRIEVGTLIRERATNPLTETISPTSYAKALSDKTAQQATGFKRATLKGTMLPDQMQTLNAIKDDLARTVAAQQAASTRGSDTIQNLAYANMIDQAGVPTFLRQFAPTQFVGNLLERGADTVYGRANREIADQLALSMLNPREAARLIDASVPPRFAALMEAIARRPSPIEGAAVGQLLQERR